MFLSLSFIYVGVADYWLFRRASRMGEGVRVFCFSRVDVIVISSIDVQAILLFV
jgi:hypothetical protein